MGKRKRILTVILYLFWALFVNACDQWILGPAAQDYAVFGVIAIFAIAGIWLTSIPKPARRRWITFTLFSLLLGQGLSNVAFYPNSSRIPLSLLMCVGLLIIAWAFARIRLSVLFVSAVGLVVANAILPVSEWPFLTHFQVAYYGRLSLDPSDMPSLPLAIVQKADGSNAVITVQNLAESKQAFEQSAVAATDSPNALEDVLRNYKHRYQFVELSENSGRFTVSDAPVTDLARVNPNDLANAFFPFTRAFWQVYNNQIVQYMAPVLEPRTGVALSNTPADLPLNVSSVAEQTLAGQQANWQQVLSDVGASQSQDALSVQNGKLTGQWSGHTLAVRVQGSLFIGTGAFTAPGTHEALVEGRNLLQVVSLDKQQVVSTYHGPTNAPIVGDIVTGPIDNSEQDAILVNQSPAYILQAGTGDAWQTLYTAPNSSLRFEAVGKFGSDTYPEIITDDPSYLRNTPTRYFTSYTYRNHQLVRNWRVYRTNVVNVRSVQFTPTGSQYLVADIFSTGKFLVLKRHELPVVPATGVLLGIFVIAGWIIRFRKRGEAHA